MKKTVFALILILGIFGAPLAQAERPGAIDFNRTGFKFGQVVYFNFGDCMQEEFDKNNFLHPHAYKDKAHIIKGIFINVEDYGFPPGSEPSCQIATVAYVDRYGKGCTLTRQVIKLIPQQRTIIFNW